MNNHCLNQSRVAIELLSPAPPLQAQDTLVKTSDPDMDSISNTFERNNFAKSKLPHHTCNLIQQLGVFYV